MAQDILEKGKSFPIGTIHNGFKKIAEGKWRKVSEKGLTKEQHEKKSEEYYRSPSSVGSDLGYEHSQHAKKLDSKEYSDTEVMGEENKNLPKGFEIKRGSLKDSGYGFKIGEMDINGETWRISFNENGSFDHATVFKNQDTRGREISLMNKKLRGLDINQDMFDSVKKDNVQKALITLEIDFLAGRIDQDTIEKARQDELEKGGNKTEFSTKEREELSEKKQAMPDGSFPIRNTQDLRDAIKSIGRAKDYEATKRWIIKRAKELDAVKLLPEDWGVKGAEEKSITPEMKKALNVLELGHILGKVSEDELEKARGHAAPVGTIVHRKDGRDWKRTHDGWEVVKKESGVKTATEQPEMSEKTKDKVFGKEYKKGDKVEYNGVTIHVGKDTSGGQDTTTYTAPSVSDKTFWDLNKLKGFIDSKGKKDKEEKFPDYLEGQEVKLSRVVELMTPSDLEKLGIEDTDPNRPQVERLNDMIEEGIKRGIITSVTKDGTTFLRFGNKKGEGKIEDLKNELKSSKDSAIISATNSYKHTQDTIDQMHTKWDILKRMDDSISNQIKGINKLDTEEAYKKYSELGNKAISLKRAIAAYEIAMDASKTIQKHKLDSKVDMDLFSDVRGLITRARDLESKITG